MTFLSVDTAEESALIAMLITAARETFEKLTGRALVSQQWRLHLDCFPYENNWRRYYGHSNRIIKLERSPLLAVDSINYFDEDDATQVLTSTVYRAHKRGSDEAGFIELLADADWPDIATRSDAIEINFTAGYGTASAVPANIKNAIFVMLKHYFDVTRQGPVNIGNITTELPFGLRSMIEMNRVGGFVA